MQFVCVLVSNGQISDPSLTFYPQIPNPMAHIYIPIKSQPRGSAVERQSLASVLLPSCARPVADG